MSQDRSGKKMAAFTRPQRLLVSTGAAALGGAAVLTLLAGNVFTLGGAGANAVEISPPLVGPGFPFCHTPAANGLPNTMLRLAQTEVIVFSIIGPNGAGKTTLFNVISGLCAPDDGQVWLGGKDVTALAPERLACRGLSRTFQNLQIFSRLTTLENVMVGRHRHESTGLIADLLHLPAVNRQNRVTRDAALKALVRVGLGAMAQRPAHSLAYGDLKRMEIARALATEPTVLLLDEPAAGCNPTETNNIETMIRGIAADGITVVLVEHDMRLVMNISDHIHVLANGHTLAEGDAAAIRANPAVIEAYLGARSAVSESASAVR